MISILIRKLLACSSHTWSLWKSSQRTHPLSIFNPWRNILTFLTRDLAPVPLRRRRRRLEFVIAAFNTRAYILHKMLNVISGGTCVAFSNPKTANKFLSGRLTTPLLTRPCKLLYLMVRIPPTGEFYLGLKDASICISTFTSFDETPHLTHIHFSRVTSR